MTGKPCPNLLSPMAIGAHTIRNRVVSTGHHTYLADGKPNDRLIAYHEARAKGGVGLIVTEIVSVHESAGFSGSLLKLDDPADIPAYRRLTDAVHAQGATIFAQLFLPGREVLSTPDGMLPIAWAPSAVPNERFHIMPKPMPVALIKDVISGFSDTAALLAQAGFDGVEIVGSHGYLPAQFLNPRVNLRNDAYGGNPDGRRKFLVETIEAIRRSAPDLALGLRISGSELDPQGLTDDEVLKACTALAPSLDYLNITGGTSASLGGSVHIAPPMGVEHGYMAPQAAAIKTLVDVPVIVTGRVNQPQIADAIISAGQADFCGMTRALISDPEMPNKAAQGDFDGIRACIACNQACIGRAHKGLGISCIQHPLSGREIDFPQAGVTTPKRVAVVGGGPAGMKAAVTAAARGHKVTLFETNKHLGGQAVLAQRLPGRDEFGGLITNLQTELARTGVSLNTSHNVVVSDLADSDFEAIVIATGSGPYVPELDGLEDATVLTAQQALEPGANIGGRVVIADWRCDWIGLGLAEKLTLQGSSVTLCINGATAGETLQLYTRNHYVGRLHKLGVDIRTHARLFGAVDSSIYFQDTLTDEPIEFEGVETLVLSLGGVPMDSLSEPLRAAGKEVNVIGDALTPRTAEEAIYEGFKLGWTL